MDSKGLRERRAEARAGGHACTQVREIRRLATLVAELAVELDRVRDDVRALQNDVFVAAG